MKITLTILILFIGFSAYSQSKIESTELKEFWNQKVLPVIDKDTSKLTDIIEFPVSGLWGFYFGYGKPDEKISKEDFYENIDLLIPQELREYLQNQSYQDIEITNESGFTELIVTFGKSNYDPKMGEYDESALLFFYKKVDGVWKLWSVTIVG